MRFFMSGLTNMLGGPLHRAVIPLTTLLLAAGLLVACNTLPRSGPLASEVSSAGRHGQIVLSNVTPSIATNNREDGSASFPAAWLEAKTVDYERFEPGDGVRVGIWERDGLGVYPAGPTGVSDLGELVVSRAGEITIPYVGPISVEGRTPAEVRSLILQDLTHVVIADDVSVAQTPTRGQFVTIQGDLTKPGIYPIVQGMVRLSGLLGLGVPDQTDPEETAVTLRRGERAASVRLSDLYRDPAQDVALRPGDSVVVSAINDHLVILGAVGGQQRLKLTKRNYTVLDAIADARGLNDNTANPGAVYLMRRDSPGATSSADHVPTVYRFDLHQPGQMVLASEFAVRDGDAILISDAPFTQVVKVFSAFSATLTTARDVNSFSQ
jgi:polysaccharide biosynthesis/export protein